MTPTDCLDVVEFLAARCPAMRLHEKTPDAWYVDLAGHSRADALEAVRACSLGADFVSLASLVAECERIRDRRVGVERVAALQAQIDQENPGELHARPTLGLVAPIHDIPRETPEDRAARRVMLAKAAHTRRELTTADVSARTEHTRRRAEAAAELERLRAERGETGEPA